MTGSAPPAVHATALVVDGVGVLIRGASGAGKSSLALALIAEAERDGVFAALVADDRVHLSVAGGRLIARSPATIAGLVERYGRGVEPIEALPAAVIRLAVDLVEADAFARMPEEAALRTTILDVAIDRQPVPARRIGEATALARAAVAAVSAAAAAPRGGSPGAVN